MGDSFNVGFDKQIDAGKELITQAERRTVHKRDYRDWAVARRRWVEVTTQILRHLYPSDTEAEEFHQVASPSAFLGRLPWNLRLDRELRATERGVRNLESLGAQLPYSSLASARAITQRTSPDAAASGHLLDQLQQRPITASPSGEEGRQRGSQAARPGRRAPLFGRLRRLPRPLAIIADIITVGLFLAAIIGTINAIVRAGGPAAIHPPKQKSSSLYPEVRDSKNGSSHSEVRNIEYHGAEEFLDGGIVVTISRLDDDKPGLETTIRHTVVTSSGKSCYFDNLGVGSQVKLMKPGRPTYVISFLKNVGYGVAVQVTQRKEGSHLTECERER
jgi:hypothetical protein